MIDVDDGYREGVGFDGRCRVWESGRVRVCRGWGEKGRSRGGLGAWRGLSGFGFGALGFGVESAA